MAEWAGFSVSTAYSSRPSVNYWMIEIIHLHLYCYEIRERTRESKILIVKYRAEIFSFRSTKTQHSHIPKNDGREKLARQYGVQSVCCFPWWRRRGIRQQGNFNRRLAFLFLFYYIRVKIKSPKPSLGHEEKPPSVSSSKSGGRHETDGLVRKKDKVKVDDSELLFFGNTRFRSFNWD